jgi:hypothetical protein
LQQQVRQLQRLLGKKAFEKESLREALDLVQPKKTDCCALKTLADALGVARPNLASAKTVATPPGGRPAKPEGELLAEIKQTVAGEAA